MAVTRHRYGAFGLSVESEFQLPELGPAHSDGEAPDIVVRRGSLDRPDGEGSDTTVHYEGPSELYLRYEVATVAVRGGREIVVDAATGVHAEVIRHLIVGPAINYLLHQRGYAVLHASTVSIDGSAVAFVGDSGTGKTTMASAFLQAGHRVLSDDVAAIRLTEHGPRVMAGYPSIKLDPEVVDQFDLPVEAAFDSCEARDRHFYGIDQAPAKNSVPLERIYVLEDGGDIEIAGYPPAGQVMTVVENTYSVGVIVDPDEATANFHRSSTLANQVPVNRLCRPRRLSVLEDVVEMVSENLSEE